MEAASVVKGTIPDNSIVYGNLARVIEKASLLVRLLLKSKNRLDTRNMPDEERERAIKKHFHITQEILLTFPRVSIKRIENIKPSKR